MPWKALQNSMCTQPAAKDKDKAVLQSDVDRLQMKVTDEAFQEVSK